MKEYRVIWEIDIAANSPREAAEEARKIQLDKHNIASIFSVYDLEEYDGIPDGSQGFEGNFDVS